MKRLKIAFIIALVTLMSSYNFYGQSKFSLEVNKPFPMGDSKDYLEGVGDLGLRFTIFNITKLDVGLGFNAGYLKDSELDFNAVAVRSKLVAQIKVLKFEPYLGVGYALFASWMPDLPEANGTDGGMNVNFGVKIFPIPKLYLNVGYDSTMFSEEDYVDASGKSNFNMLMVGIGLEL